MVNISIVPLIWGKKRELEGNGRQPIQTVVSLVEKNENYTAYTDHRLPIIVADLPFVVMNRLTPLHQKISCSPFPPVY